MQTRDRTKKHRRGVVFVSSNKELERILDHPFEAWRIFLHPAQRKIAYASQYAESIQVTGGAGTGKPTALHRAAFLASRASEEVFAGESGRSVLLTMPITGLDDETDSLVGYRSPLHGRHPEVHAASSQDAELAALVEGCAGGFLTGSRRMRLGAPRGLDG